MLVNTRHNNGRWCSRSPSHAHIPVLLISPTISSLHPRRANAMLHSLYVPFGQGARESRQVLGGFATRTPQGPMRAREPICNHRHVSALISNLLAGKLFRDPLSTGGAAWPMKEVRTRDEFRQRLQPDFSSALVYTSASYSTRSYAVLVSVAVDWKQKEKEVLV